MVTYVRPKTLVKRIPTILDPVDKIQKWDYDNLYPQRMEELASRSYTLRAVLNVVSDFLAGEGFVDEAFSKVVVNKDSFIEETMGDLLNKVCDQYANYQIPCLHFGFNMNGAIDSIRIVPVSYVRLGYPTKEGIVTHLMYSTNWERATMKEANLDRVIIPYHLFNPEPTVVKAQIAEAGGIQNYRGQIMFFTPELYCYPKATFDSVSDHAQTQAELGVFKLSSIQNKFAATMAIMYPGQFESTTEEANFKALVNNKSGSAAAGSNIGIQDPTGTKKVNEIFLPITPVNTDRLFELTEKSSTAAIMENEAVPKELIGVRPETGMFNQDNMEQSYIYYNARTKKRRTIISRLFSHIGRYLAQPVITTAEITPLEYMTDEQKAAQAESQTKPKGDGKKTDND